MNGEASLDANASIQARNLFFSAYDLWTRAYITITENVTFDIVEYFRNGYNLGGFLRQGGNISAVSFNATAGNDFVNRHSATISADNFNVTVIGATFYNIGSEIYANSFDVTAGTSFENEKSAIINVENFNVTTGTYFDNYDFSVISAVSFNVTSEKDFVNNDNSTINVDNFNVTAGTDFVNNDNSTINVDNFNVTAGTDFVNNDNSTINVDNFNVASVTGDFINTSSSTIAADTVTIEVENFSNDIDNTATVSSDSLNFILTADFTHNSTTLNGFNNFSNLGVSTDGSFTNNATINPTGSLTITANSFANTGGVVNVDTFNLSINNDFDYVTGYRSNGTITDSALNLNVAGNFSYDNVNHFIWAASDSLTVAGNADITADNYTQNGAIDVTGALTINVGSDFDYIADFNGAISFNSLDLSVGGNFSYDDSANNFTWGAQNNLTVLGNADITTFNYNQSGIVDVAGRFDVTTTNNFVTYKGSTLNVADGLYVAAANGVFLGPDSTVINDSTISADTFDFTVGGTNFNTWGAKISANNGRINLTHSDGILNNYSGEINVTNNFDITTDQLKNERNIIVGDTLTVTLNSDTLRNGFINVNNFNYEGISADTFNFSVNIIFNYEGI